MKEILLVEGDIDFEVILTENLEKDCKIISFDYLQIKLCDLLNRDIRIINS